MIMPFVHRYIHFAPWPFTKPTTSHQSILAALTMYELAVVLFVILFLTIAKCGLFGKYLSDIWDGLWEPYRSGPSELPILPKILVQESNMIQRDRMAAASLSFSASQSVKGAHHRIMIL
ncbi:hypothetical protein ASPBRDRAFT_565168 [Aspergillus brasiliensis CBS 101740]|uniref:Uncharacterized protein n=1 Tax=Aspergillus brasiliensis (strain CBS 101740 / IMI 381727 / IBT 21946) TaxID=767769 RepID=A0A1L9U1H0_ASPBC|nr:hypothetical protein ASPBRDRAFT_565168 [Aspergillus brasiliensis CBS 101740]